MKMFPIQDSRIKSIPWEKMDRRTVREQAYRNHEQSIERLAQRRGLSSFAAVAALTGNPLFCPLCYKPHLREHCGQDADYDAELEKLVSA